LPARLRWRSGWRIGIDIDRRKFQMGDFPLLLAERRSAASVPTLLPCYIATLPAGASTILFERTKVTADAAAFLNATMVRFLDGIAYEIQMRLQDAASLFRRGWDHVNFVTVSATMAVGKLLNLSRTQLVHALGMALNGHIAMRQVRSGELSGWKGASAANASRNAVFCAHLARHGMTGPSSIFEGEMGFFNQVSGRFDVRAFGNRENGDFRIMHTLTKLYPTNGEMQTAVMAAIALREELPNLEDIVSIRIDTTDLGFKFLAKDPAKWRPTTRETADHSLPYTVARALLDGTITRSTYDEADLADARVIEIIDKTSVREDPVLTAQMPSLANRVTIETRSGKVVSKQLGTNEIADSGIAAEIERKFRDFARTRMPQEQMRTVLDVCWRLENQQSLEPLFAALMVPHP
jgi:2-methylcitrate dehydratase